MTFSHLTPLFRHNLLFGRQVGTKIRHVGEEEEVNTPQNPHMVSVRGQRLCKSGSFALVIGAGSGSKVVGLAHLECT